MRTYPRVRSAGGRSCFTLKLAARRGNALLVRHLADLRAACRPTRREPPLALDAMGVVPAPWPGLWRVPVAAAAFPLRGRLLKARCSSGRAPGADSSRRRQPKGARGMWQRGYWEQVIRDEHDYRQHVDDLHYHRVKHGYVQAAKEWPYSSFLRWVKRGLYPIDWAAAAEVRDWSREYGICWDSLRFIPAYSEVGRVLRAIKWARYARPTFKEFLLAHAVSTSFSVVAQREPFDCSTLRLKIESRDRVRRAY